MGWRAWRRSLLLPVGGEVFPLTLPFIELRDKNKGIVPRNGAIRRRYRARRRSAPPSRRTPDAIPEETGGTVNEANKQRCGITFSTNAMMTGPGHLRDHAVLQFARLELEAPQPQKVSTVERRSESIREALLIPGIGSQQLMIFSARLVRIRNTALCHIDCYQTRPSARNPAQIGHHS